ncbi:MAG: phosphodiester glycosidase family protein [Deltaproteobacteria bacterium]|nr:phosphodiester glycosidase family protein [Deltaproteobacteria bacterium]
MRAWLSFAHGLPRRLPLLLGVPVLLAAAALVLLQPRPTGPLSLADATRREVAPGVEVLTARVHRRSLRAGRLVALFAEPSAVSLELFVNEEQAALRDLADGALAVVNAGYFTQERRPTGLLVSGGKVLSPFVPNAGAAGSGVLVVDDDEVRLFARDEVRPSTYRGAALAIQAGPRVVEPGGAPGIHSDDGARANRTVLGRDGRGRLVLVVIHNPDGGQAAGPTLHELMTLLGPEGVGRVAPELALDFALNLDGGPSTGLSLRDEAVEAELREAYPVLSVLALSPSR